MTEEAQPRQRGYDRDESVDTRLDRNYSELLQELRISETGVQVLFGFLLAISFQQRFAEIDDFEKAVFVTTLLCCALSIGLLVAPVAYHRVVFRRGLKDKLVQAASGFVIAGTTFMLLAIIGSVLLILDFAIGRVFGVVTASILMALFLALWVALPLTAVRRARRSEPLDTAPPLS
ncbi:MAG: hypothetical protein JWN61_1013 [Pseudonocardiales bacterium]|nr:hypothetical protein [Jatrophihabitantaceae bacterium]MCW2602878.1 hypothetical protein [Pseudonocardiales bacterium]